MQRKFNQKQCFKKFEKERVTPNESDIIPNCPITLETDLSNSKENFDQICQNFLGQWSEANIRTDCPKVKENVTKKKEKKGDCEKSETNNFRQKATMVNNFFLGFI